MNSASRGIGVSANSRSGTVMSLMGQEGNLIQHESVPWVGSNF